jgi:hypothetical protein
MYREERVDNRIKIRVKSNNNKQKIEALPSHNKFSHQIKLRVQK